MKRVIPLALVFVLGAAVGAVAAKKKVDPSLYRGKDKPQAAEAILVLAKEQAGKGSWENIAVGRVYYLGGQKDRGQAVFDAVIERKAKASDWIRMGRVYVEAGDWDKAKQAFDQVRSLAPNDASKLAEIGVYYNVRGEREIAEELFRQALDLEPRAFWPLVNIAGSYLEVSWE